MTALLHFEDKVHRKSLVRAESLPLLMPRLLSQVLEHLGFPEEPRIERRISCTQVLSMGRSLTMPISFVLQQQDQEEVPDEIAEDPPRGEDPVPEVEVEVERSPVHDLSLPSKPPPPSAPAPADTAGSSFTSQHSPEHVQVSLRELAAVMDAVCALATTQASLDQRLTQTEATIEQSHAMLLRIMGHLGLSPDPTHRDHSTAATSLDMLAATASASDHQHIHHHRESEVVTLISLAFLSSEACLYFGWEEKIELGVSSIMFCNVFSFINCLLILYRIHVLANSRQ